MDPIHRRRSRVGEGWQRLGAGQHGLRIRNHVRGGVLAALDMVIQQGLDFGHALTAYKSSRCCRRSSRRRW
jgi:hypothetical protein